MGQAATDNLSLKFGREIQFENWISRPFLFRSYAQAVSKDSSYRRIIHLINTSEARKIRMFGDQSTA